MKLFLDDLRTVDMVYPNPNMSEWVIVRSFHQFVNYINKYGLPDYISFDHDLGFTNEYYIENNLPSPEPDKTGYDAVKWLVDYCVENNKPLPLWYVHSQNPIGVKNITTYLKNAEKHLGLGI